MSVPDHYCQLGISPRASQRAIRAAYRRHLLRCHPDTNGGRRSDEAELHRVLEAGRVLGDPERRAAYDQTLLSHRGSPGTAQIFLPLNLTGNLKQLGASIFRRWAVLHARFFSAEKAAQFRHAHRKRVRQSPPEFSEYLTMAIRRKPTGCYELHSDGVWRRKESGADFKPCTVLHKRARLWLLLIFVLKLWRG